MTEEYATVKIPSDLIAEVDKLVGKHGYKSRAEVVKDALRQFFKDVERGE